MEIAVAHRSGPQLRCAYCHDRIAEADPCGGCGAVVHTECGSMLGGCPTLGCGHVATVLRPRAAEPFQDTLFWRVVGWTVLLMGGFAGAVGLFAGLGRDLGWSPRDLIGLAFAALLGPAAAASVVLMGWITVRVWDRARTR